MPKKNPEHDARVEIRLPSAMLAAMRCSAEVDQLPLAAWIRDAIQRRTFSYMLVGGGSRASATAGDFTRARNAPKEAGTTGRSAFGRGRLPAGMSWRGGREAERAMTLRTYADYSGNQHIGHAPDGDQDRQDLFIDRQKARTELRNWLHRWGREGKTMRLKADELRLVDKLLAKFDQDHP